MSSWITQIKRQILAFLATHDDKYVVTKYNQKILMFDRRAVNRLKVVSDFTNKTKGNTTWSNKLK